MRTAKISSPAYYQNGSVLIISMLFLLVLTILGVTAMSSSSLEEKMASNMRERQLALQAAEAALREAERIVSANDGTWDYVTAFTTTCNAGLCDCSDATTCTVDYWTDSTLNVWGNAGKHYSYGGSLPSVNTQAKFIIEYLGSLNNTTTNPGGVAGCPGCPRMYRITALGTGLSDSTKVMLQSIYRMD